MSSECWTRAERPGSHALPSPCWLSSATYRRSVTKKNRLCPPPQRTTSDEQRMTQVSSSLSCIGSWAILADGALSPPAVWCQENVVFDGPFEQWARSDLSVESKACIVIADGGGTCAARRRCLVIYVNFYGSSKNDERRGPTC